MTGVPFDVNSEFQVLSTKTRTSGTRVFRQTLAVDLQRKSNHLALVFWSHPTAAGPAITAKGKLIQSELKNAV